MPKSDFIGVANSPMSFCLAEDVCSHVLPEITSKLLRNLYGMVFAYGRCVGERNNMIEFSRLGLIIHLISFQSERHLIIESGHGGGEFYRFRLENEVLVEWDEALSVLEVKHAIMMIDYIAELIGMEIGGARGGLLADDEFPLVIVDDIFRKKKCILAVPKEFNVEGMLSLFDHPEELGILEIEDHKVVCLKSDVGRLSNGMRHQKAMVDSIPLRVVSLPDVNN